MKTEGHIGEIDYHITLGSDPTRHILGTWKYIPFKKGAWFEEEAFVTKGEADVRAKKAYDVERGHFWSTIPPTGHIDVRVWKHNHDTDERVQVSRLVNP